LVFNFSRSENRGRRPFLTPPPPSFSKSGKKFYPALICNTQSLWVWSSAVWRNSSPGRFFPSWTRSALVDRTQVETTSPKEMPRFFPPTSLAPRRLSRSSTISFSPPLVTMIRLPRLARENFSFPAPFRAPEVPFLKGCFWGLENYNASVASDSSLRFLGKT